MAFVAMMTLHNGARAEFKGRIESPPTNKKILLIASERLLRMIRPGP